MRIEWSQNPEVNSTVLSAFAQHILLVFEEKSFSALPFAELLSAKLARAGLTAADLTQKPLTLEWPDGRLVSLVQLDANSSSFAINSLLRAAVKPLLEECPTRIAIGIYAKNRLINSLGMRPM